LNHGFRPSLPGARRTLIRQGVARNLRAAQLLWRNRATFFERFAGSFRALQELPPRLRLKFFQRGLATTLAGAALLLAPGGALPTHAAAITVDGVVCTLAEAIDSANADDAGGNGCADGNGYDTIQLKADVLLEAPLPAINSAILLAGNGHIVDGAGLFRVLEVSPAGYLAVQQADITGGNSGEGGGIHNLGILALLDCNITGNSADEGGGLYNGAGASAVISGGSFDSNIVYEGGGIFNLGFMSVSNADFIQNESFGDFEDIGGGGISNQPGGTAVISGGQFLENFGASGGAIWNGGSMDVMGSTLTGNISYDEFFGSGGGIRNTGVLTVTESTLDENLAFDGGGISSDGALVVRRSTISGNRADYSGGGIKVTGGTAEITNSTVSGNETFVFDGGGIYADAGAVELNNTTVTTNLAAGRGGGIFSDTSAGIVLNRNLVAGNSAADSGPEAFNSSLLTADGYNVFGYSNVSGVTGFNPGTSDIVPGEPLPQVLDHALAQNGGPTRTHALPPGSPAIDTAPSGACAAGPVAGIDQRGASRSQNGDGAPGSDECDAGAYEFDPFPVKRYFPLIFRN